MIQSLSYVFLICGAIALILYIFAENDKQKDEMVSTQSTGQIICDACRVLFSINGILLMISCLCACVTVFGYTAVYYSLWLKQIGYQCQIQNFWLLATGLAGPLVYFFNQFTHLKKWFFPVKIVSLVSLLLLIFVTHTQMYISNILIQSLLVIVASFDNAISFALFGEMALYTKQYKTLGASFMNAATMYSGFILSSFILLFQSFVDPCVNIVNIATISTPFYSFFSIFFFLIYCLKNRKK